MYGTGYKSEYKNWGSITYSTDQENKLSEIFIISLGSNREERFWIYMQPAIQWNTALYIGQ